MHTRDYSDHTFEGHRRRDRGGILREQESRAIEVLTLHRRGLESLTRALLEHETIDGAKRRDSLTRRTASPCTPREQRRSAP